MCLCHYRYHCASISSGLWHYLTALHSTSSRSRGTMSDTAMYDAGGYIKLPDYGSFWRFTTALTWARAYQRSTSTLPASNMEDWALLKCFGWVIPAMGSYHVQEACIKPLWTTYSSYFYRFWSWGLNLETSVLMLSDYLIFLSKVPCMCALGLRFVECCICSLLPQFLSLVSFNFPRCTLPHINWLPVS